MSFSNIGGLFWLIPLAGTVILLYLLRMRRKDLRVPATFLWPVHTEEIRANTWFQKLRFSWLLVLQLLAVLFAVLAFAQPQRMEQGLGGSSTTIVLDVSASMQATDVKPSRQAEAIRLANEVISSAKPGDQLSLIEAGATPRVVFSSSSDVATMKRRLSTVVGTDAESDVGEALRLAAAIARKQQNSRIILLSDGVFPDVDNFSRGKSDVSFAQIGESGKNAGLTAVSVRDTSQGKMIFAGIKNYSLDETSGSLDLLVDGEVFDSSKWSARAGQSVGRTVKAPQGSVYEAVLKHDDYLTADNRMFALGSLGSRIKTLLLSNGDLFVERVLSLDPRIELYKASTPPANSEWDLVVFDGVEEVPVKAKAVLSLGTTGPDSPVTLNGRVKQPIISDVEVEYRSGIDWEGVYVEEGLSVKAKRASKVHAEFQTRNSSSPALVTSESQGIRRLFLAFSPLQSDFPLQAGFPIFFSKAIDWLIPPQSTDSDILVSTGRPFVIPSEGKKSVQLKTPSQGERTIEASQGTFVVRELSRTGGYKLGDRNLYANLQSEGESNISPNIVAKLGDANVKGGAPLARLNDYWRWFAAILLTILAIEWIVFVRKS